MDGEELPNERGLRISLVLSDEDVYVRGDGSELLRAVENLLVNALHHARGHIVIALLRTDGEAVIDVADDGTGFSPDEALRLFAPFVRGRRVARRGMGLGLAIVRRIARDHGGDAAASSEARGTRFTLRLPLAETAPAVTDA